jgi:hypothetical protein
MAHLVLSPFGLGMAPRRGQGAGGHLCTMSLDHRLQSEAHVFLISTWRPLLPWYPVDVASGESPRPIVGGRHHWSRHMDETLARWMQTEEAALLQGLLGKPP